MQTAEIDLPLTVVARGRSATRRRRSKRRVWPWIVGVSLLVLVQLWLIWGSGDEPARTARPVAASAIAPAEWIAAIGQLEPEGGVVEVAAARNAREAVVTALSVAAGAEVRMGDPLARLETLPRATAALAEAEADLALRRAELEGALRAARADHAEAESRVALAALQLDEAERALARADRLVGGQAVATAARDDLRTARDMRKAELDSARAGLVRVSGAAEDLPDVQAARARLAQAEAALRVARIGVAEATIRAPADGTILSVPARVGEPVPPDGLVRLAVAGGMEARLEVHEDEIALVRPEAGVTLQAAGITGPLTGQVVRIGQEVVRQGVFSDDPAAKTDARVFEVRVALDAASAARARELIQLQVLAWIETGPASAEATP